MRRRRAGMMGIRSLDMGAPLRDQSRGAPLISRGLRQVLPVKRRIVARSTSRSTVAMAWDSEGKRFFQWEKPVLAVRMMEPCPYRADTTRNRWAVAAESKGSYANSSSYVQLNIT